MRLRFFVGVLVAVGLVAISGIGVNAYINEDVYLVNKNVGIAVSPVKSERYKMIPGGEYDGRFRVRQTGHETSEIMITLAPLSALRDYETETDRTRIKNWTTFDIEGCDVHKVEDGNAYLMMRSKEECFVNYHIKVPRDAVGGSQNAAILVRSLARNDVGAQKDESALRYQYQFAYSLLSDVDAPGATYDGKVLKNNVPSILLDPPLGVDSLIENTGTLDFTAFYSVTMIEWLREREVYANSWDALAMADGKVDQEDAWKEAPVLGLFWVTQEVRVLDETSSVTKLVLIIPIWLILIIVGVILLLIWAIVIKVRGHKKKRS